MSNRYISQLGSKNSKGALSIPYILQIISFIFLVALVGYNLKFNKELQSSLEKSESTLKNLFLLEEKLFSENKQIHKAVDTLATSTSVQQDLIDQANKFTVIKAIYSTTAKIKNGLSIKNELEIISHYQNEEIQNLAAQIEQISASPTLSNAEIYQTLISMTANKRSSDTSGSVLPMSSIIKVTNTKDLKDNKIIIEAAKAIKSNDMDEAFEILSPISKNYAEIMEMISVIQRKKVVNSLLNQILDKVIYNT